MFAKIKKALLFVSDPVFLTSLRLNNALECAIKPHVHQVNKCLDVGCGNRPYEYMFKAGSYIGVDVESSGRPAEMKQADHYYDGKTLPFSDDTFDMVISTQVLEHVPNPTNVLMEMARVCKPNGSLIVSLPFVYQEHEEPYDFFRFTSFGFEELAQRAGLEVEVMKKDSTAIETIAILINVYMMHNLVPNIRGLGRVFALLICFPIQIIAMVLSKLLPNKGQLYLNLVVHAKKR